MNNPVSNAQGDMPEQEESCCSNTSCCPPQTPVRRAAAKVGRNDPCPCDSGRKYKKCCGANA